MKISELSFTAKYACRAYVENETAIWNLTIPVSELPKGLPYGPNARNASLNAKPAKEMLKTLSEEPEKFILYNGGIMLIAESIDAKRIDGGDFKVKIELIEPTEDDEGDFLGQGVLNGGHTYKAITHAFHGLHTKRESYPNIYKAYVQVSVAVGIDEQEIAKISRARNLSLSVPLYALRNLNKDWSAIEKALPEEYRKNVVFKPNEDGEFEKASYTVVDLIRRLALLNNNLFDFRQQKHPSKAYHSPGSLVQQWKKEDYQEVIPLLKDILWLEEKIMQQHVEVNGRGANKKIVVTKVSGCKAKKMKLITGAEIPITIGEIFYMPVLAAFRVLIKDGKWTKPVEELWEEWGEKLVDKLWDTYKKEGRSSASAFARSPSTWSELTNMVAMSFVQI